MQESVVSFEKALVLVQGVTRLNTLVKDTPKVPVEIAAIIAQFHFDPFRAGQLFVRYKEGRCMPAGMVRVLFDDMHKPERLLAQTAEYDYLLNFSDNMYVAYGHFGTDNDDVFIIIKKELCFSIGNLEHILNFVAPDGDTTHLWVNGLR